MRASAARVGLFTGVALIAAAHGRATAQDATADEAAVADSSAARSSETIVVTGSRIVRDGYDAPTPTTVLGLEEIQSFAPANLADYVNQLPELAGSISPITGRNGVTSGGNFLNLRGLGTNRTLVLLDGRRVAPSSLTGGVDFSLLPTSLTQRVEVVTGGASAAWGSDAVAGVVNLILDRDLSGLRGEIQGGITDEGDGRQFRASFSFGTSFAGGRGHLLLSAEHNDVQGINRAGTRDWYRGWNIVANPDFVPGGSVPRRIIVPGVGLANSTPGGIVTAGPLRGTAFLPGGGTTVHDFGFVSGLLSFGGDGYLAGSNTQILLPLSWDTAFARASFEVTDGITVFAEGSYGKTDNLYQVRPYQRDNNLTISIDNAFLDPATRARMEELGLQSFVMGKVHSEFGPSTVVNERELMRGVAGAFGRLGAGWDWDAYYQYGRSRIDAAAGNNPIIANYNRAVDSVRDPATGNAVCRSTLTSPGNGCVPLNVFGVGSASEAAIAYIMGEATQETVIEQHVAAVNLRGQPLALWAGSLAVAMGLEYREERYDAVADPLSRANSFFLGNYQDSSGRFDVKEAYLEAELPLLADLPGVDRLALDGAIRLTDYSTSGSVTTWKLGASWTVVPDLRLRATRSRDIRAPNLNELFLASSITNVAITDPVSNTTYLVQRVIAGNRALEPERADTLSFGAIVTPRWVPGLSLSVDYFDIEIDDAIFTPDAQTVVDQCQAGVQSLCDAITRGSAGLVTQLRVLPQNVLSESIDGIDFEASWRGGLGPGRLGLRLLASHIFSRRIDSFGEVVEYAGVSGDGNGVPDWRGLASATYAVGNFSTTLTARYVGSSVVRHEWGPADVSDNEVPSRTYLDLAGSYRFDLDGEEVEFFGIVQNLLDTDPPVAVSSAGNAFTSLGTNAAFFDTIGRQFRFGVRFRF